MAPTARPEHGDVASAMAMIAAVHVRVIAPHMRVPGYDVNVVTLPVVV